MTLSRLGVLFAVLVFSAVPVRAQEDEAQSSDRPYIVVLGEAQDAGAPQAGSFGHPGWKNAEKRALASSIGLVDPQTNSYWIFDASPDFPEQWHMLHETSAGADFGGVFLTHAHIGHYTGLMYLGHEVAGTTGLPVYAMPRMKKYLESNGPWSQLVRYENIALVEMADGIPVKLTEQIEVTPFLVPHRQEFSEVVGFIISGPQQRVLFLPDIDSWKEWEEQGVDVAAIMQSVDHALIDATFYADGEIPGRDMSTFPHPFITTSMAFFSHFSDAEKRAIIFTHMNHTNPVLRKESAERSQVLRNGFSVAHKGLRIAL